ncbi:hypothetical protein ACIPM2_36185 [Streptomyces sp. NPDC086081]|uniref:hypothetical protein n=1 Tax=Streptomyces sp. NPDC086081 TaxID=3365749 RepID=UPI003800C5D6
MYASSITSADIEAIEAFLAARFNGVAVRHRPRAPETRIARSLYETAGYQLDQLKNTLAASSPETLRERLNLWNGLMHLLEP